MGNAAAFQQIIPELIKQFPMIEVLYLFGSRAFSKHFSNFDDLVRAIRPWLTTTA